MILFIHSNLWFMITLSLFDETTAVSYNLPKLCSNAEWKSNGITFESFSGYMSGPTGIFVDINDTIYANSWRNYGILIWLNGSNKPTETISTGVHTGFSLFVTANGDIYADNGTDYSRVDKWVSNRTNSTIAMHGNGACTGLFVDTQNNIYCSMFFLNHVIKKLYNDSVNISSTVAGTGCPGVAPHMLYNPGGIFVDTNFTLFVADASNNRIQKFLHGQANGTTVAGSGPSDSSQLYHPTGVVLDADGNLYITDQLNNRIVRKGPDGLRCLVGCSKKSSLAADHLYLPWALSFDSVGNIFVSDHLNYRIQKFDFITTSCGETSQGTITSTLLTEGPPTNLPASSLPTDHENTASTVGISYNQPKLCLNASWESNGITFADFSKTRAKPTGIFIDTNNTVYVDGFENYDLMVWFHTNNTFMKNISAGLIQSFSVFVTANGDIYVDNGHMYRQVNIWTFNATISTATLHVTGSCTGLFVDIQNNVYCSMFFLNQVTKISRVSVSDTHEVIAGTGCPGVAPHMLYNPGGIFVDTNFTLFVADASNNRIQKFLHGQANGTTVAGSGPSDSSQLYHPTGVVLDADGNLYITDQHNNRIVRKGLDGLRCLVGCSKTSSLAADHLYDPWALSFDSVGNIFVSDHLNYRIQKFDFITSSCDFADPTTTDKMTSSTSTTSNSDSMFQHATSVYSELITITAEYPAGMLTFVPISCSNKSQIGVNCSASATACDLFHPCQNNGSCLNTNTTSHSYNCSCSAGFDGDYCEIDIRPCKPHTCWNDGVCKETSDTTFNCSCQPGWIGVHCELKRNYCEGVKCLNNGVCRPLLLNFTCECLGVSYSGRYCEITARDIIVRQTVSKSFGYIAILCITGVALFILTLDFLKYIFGIDPVKEELEKIRKAEAAKKVRRRRIAIRFIYVNKPLPTIDEEQEPTA